MGTPCIHIYVPTYVMSGEVCSLFDFHSSSELSGWNMVIKRKTPIHLFFCEWCNNMVNKCDDITYSRHYCLEVKKLAAHCFKNSPDNGHQTTRKEQYRESDRHRSIVARKQATCMHLTNMNCIINVVECTSLMWWTVSLI